MTIVTFKDGVSVKLHENGDIDFIQGSDYDSDYNYHMIMALSDAPFVNQEEHIEALFNKLNRRLGGILSP